MGAVLLPLRSSCVGAYNHRFAHVQVFPDPSQRAGFRVQIIDGHVEETLDLAGVQIHGDDMVAPGGLEHIRHQLRRDGRPRLILLVLSRVGEIGDDGGDAAGGGGLAGVDDDEEFHQTVVDVAGRSGLEDEDLKRHCLVCALR